jgi:hypothetical protein
MHACSTGNASDKQDDDIWRWGTIKGVWELCFKVTTKNQESKDSPKVEKMTTPVKVGPFGGRGTSGKDIDPSQLPKILEKIEIWSSADGPGSGGFISGIRFTYVDTSDKRHVIPSPDTAWGTTDGTAHEPVRTSLGFSIIQLLHLITTPFALLQLILKLLVLLCGLVNPLPAKLSGTSQTCMSPHTLYPQFLRSTIYNIYAYYYVCGHAVQG